jgi:cytochrome b subunit of formate dehydrogenase
VNVAFRDADRAGKVPVAAPIGLHAAQSPKPRSDIGTILIHWVAAIAMVASLFTGLRISADAREAVVSRFLAPILPQGEVWTVHFIAGLALFFSLTAYVVYLAAADLFGRNAPKRVASLTLPGSSKAVRRARWNALNIILHWVMYGAVIVMTATGIALYLGHGGWVVAVHAAAAIGSLAYIVIHVVAHFMYGGWQQLLRLFRPARLEAGRGRMRRPLLLASAIGVPVVAGLAYADVASRDRLLMNRVEKGPDIGRFMDDPAWAAARPVFVNTNQGVNLGGRGESRVEIRAMRDDANAYFAFRWEDPSRSLRRVPVVKKADGWYVMDSGVARADTVEFYEDKFSVLFSRSDAFGNGGTTHMGPKPLDDKPSGPNKRGFHYTTDGSYADVWQWKAARGGMLGAVEDMHFGPPTEPTPAEAAGTARYQAGYWGDPGKSMYRYNYPAPPPEGYDKAPVKLSRLPTDWQAVVRSMGRVDPDPGASVDETRNGGCSKPPRRCPTPRSSTTRSRSAPCCPPS